MLITGGLLTMDDATRKRLKNGCTLTAKHQQCASKGTRKEKTSGTRKCQRLPSSCESV